MNFVTDFIEKINELQFLLMTNGGGELNIEVDKQMFDKLSYDFNKIMKYVNQTIDKPTNEKLTLYGPMCKTIIRKNND